MAVITLVRNLINHRSNLIILLTLMENLASFKVTISQLTQLGAFLIKKSKALSLANTEFKKTSNLANFPGEVHYNYNIKPERQALTLGISYHF